MITKLQSGGLNVRVPRSTSIEDANLAILVRTLTTRTGGQFEPNGHGIPTVPYQNLKPLKHKHTKIAQWQ